MGGGTALLGAPGLYARYLEPIGGGLLIFLLVALLLAVPFVILLIVMIPLTVALVGTSLGVAGAIPPLVAGAAPFFARLVETALREVDKGVIEASFAMGAKRRQVVLGALLPDARQTQPSHSTGLTRLPIDQIHADRANPRKSFDEAELERERDEMQRQGARLTEERLKQEEYAKDVGIAVTSTASSRAQAFQRFDDGEVVVERNGVVGDLLGAVVDL